MSTKTSKKRLSHRPNAWLRHALERLPQASSVEDYEALMPWNCKPRPHS
nr:transposase domain-containing protein [Pseudomonas fluorescens]